MFDKFGEFDSCEELNRAAEAQRAEGDEEALKAIAKENGIDIEDAEDFMDGCVEEFTTPLMAAVGKLKVETMELGLAGVMLDWKDQIVAACAKDAALQIAVRRKKKSLAECLAVMLRFAFENKVQVSDQVVSITKVTQNGKEVPMRKPVYLGIPNRVQVEKLMREYYLGGTS